MKTSIILLFLYSACSLHGQVQPNFLLGNTWSVMQNPAYCGLDKQLKVSMNGQFAKYQPRETAFGWDTSIRNKLNSRTAKKTDYNAINATTEYAFKPKCRPAIGITVFRDQVLWDLRDRLDITTAVTVLKTPNGLWRIGVQGHAFRYIFDADKIQRMFPGSVSLPTNDIYGRAYGLTIGVLRRYKSFTGGVSGFNLWFTPYKTNNSYYGYSLWHQAYGFANYTQNIKSVKLEHHLLLQYNSKMDMNISSVGEFRHILFGAGYLANNGILSIIAGYRNKHVDIRLGVADSTNRYFLRSSITQLSAAYFL